jgi:flagellin-like hook-associated protein FlgL
MKAEAASLKIGIQNGTEAMQAVEMLNNDIQAMNDIVVRLEELHALGTNGFNTTTDTAALTAEANKLMTEMLG